MRFFAFSGKVSALMPITQSAKKAMRASARKRVFNSRRKDNMKELIKQFRISPKKESLPALYQAIDKAAKRGVIAPGTAARRKSRLSALLVS